MSLHYVAHDDCIMSFGSSLELASGSELDTMPVVAQKRMLLELEILNDKLSATKTNVIESREMNFSNIISDIFITFVRNVTQQCDDILDEVPSTTAVRAAHTRMFQLFTNIEQYLNQRTKLKLKAVDVKTLPSGAETEEDPLWVQDLKSSVSEFDVNFQDDLKILKNQILNQLRIAKSTLMDVDQLLRRVENKQEVQLLNFNSVEDSFNRTDQALNSFITGSILAVAVAVTLAVTFLRH
jgi:hypothetical protein